MLALTSKDPKPDGPLSRELYFKFKQRDAFSLFLNKVLEVIAHLFCSDSFSSGAVSNIPIVQPHFALIGTENININDDFNFH